jgi:hypothetical protein
MLWFIAWVIGPPIQKGRDSEYNAEIAPQAATAYCSGRVHDVGWRVVGGICWYVGGPESWPAGTQADPFQRFLPSCESVLNHCWPSQ